MCLGLFLLAFSRLVASAKCGVIHDGQDDLWPHVIVWSHLEACPDMIRRNISIRTLHMAKTLKRTGGNVWDKLDGQVFLSIFPGTWVERWDSFLGKNAISSMGIVETFELDAERCHLVIIVGVDDAGE